MTLFELVAENRLEIERTNSRGNGYDSSSLFIEKEKTNDDDNGGNKYTRFGLPDDGEMHDDSND